MPPGVPKARVRALRAAFDTMIKDPKFLNQAKKSRLALRTASGQEIEQIVANVVNAPADAIERLRKLMVAKGRGARCQDYTSQAFCRAPKKRKGKKSK